VEIIFVLSLEMSCHGNWSSSMVNEVQLLIATESIYFCCQCAQIDTAFCFNQLTNRLRFWNLFDWWMSHQIQMGQQSETKAYTLIKK